VNDAHLVFCSSDEWADAVKKWIIPGATNGVALGANVLEIGPGPGRTTEVLKDMVSSLTALEIDAMLAEQLRTRLADTNVTVVDGDGTAMPFPDDHFDTALSFTMLHHVPSAELQDKLFAEARRVVKAGGLFIGVDSRDGEDFRKLHVDDICVPLDPATIEARLKAAGFSAATLEPNEYVIQFKATV
jgi:ubiquinone/menaquinone biosynthesis C-methylase UbiE